MKMFSVKTSSNGNSVSKYKKILLPKLCNDYHVIKKNAEKMYV